MFRFALTAGVFLFPAALPLLAQDASPRPNFLFILSDDQRFDALGCAGHKILKTPNIDGLAARGLRFRNMFVTTPICAASRASILTGVHERTHKFTFGTPPLDTSFTATSFPMLLRNAGYRTGLIGKFGVTLAPGQAAKMFDVLVELQPPFLRQEATGALRHIDQIATDRALTFLEQQDPKKPFYLSVHFNSPHAEDGKLDNLYPWPETVAGLYDDVAIPLPPPAEEKVFRAEPDFLRKGLNRIRWHWQFDTPEKYVKNVRAYYRMTSGIDHEIGRLLAELARLGLADNTVVVFMSDNGYFLGERGFSGKWVHYEESLRVPLIVADPRVPASQRGRAADEMVLNLDLAPTLLALAGVAIPREYQGRSLVPLIRGEKTAWRHDFFCEHLFVHPDIAQWEGVRGQRYVYARYFGERLAYEFLHDLQEDPRELVNLATVPAKRQLLEHMRQRSAELRDAYGGPYDPERFPILKKKS